MKLLPSIELLINIVIINNNLVQMNPIKEIENNREAINGNIR